jgi:hypothetical protein
MRPVSRSMKPTPNALHSPVISGYCPAIFAEVQPIQYEVGHKCIHVRQIDRTAMAG